MHRRILLIALGLALAATAVTGAVFVRQQRPGATVASSPAAGMTGGYDVRLVTDPAQASPNTALRLQLIVVEKASGKVVDSFQAKHGGTRLHAYVMSDDLSYSRSLVIEAGRGEAFTTTVALPKDGAYSVYSEFTPSGTSGSTLVRSALSTARGTAAKSPRWRLLRM